jgi:hypothetical protein
MIPFRLRAIPNGLAAFFSFSMTVFTSVTYTSPYAAMNTVAVSYCIRRPPPPLPPFRLIPRSLYRSLSPSLVL